LLERDSTIVVIAFDTDRDSSTGTSKLPGDPGASFRGTDELITAWGTGGSHTRFSSGKARSTPLRVATDLAANQMTIVVPRNLSNPHRIWRASVATGLHNPKDHSWLKPVFGPPTSEAPGGGRLGGTSGIFNLAFRFTEAPRGITPMDSQQAAALSAGDAARFARDIDFGKLDRRVGHTTVPRTGTMVRIFPSRIDAVPLSRDVQPRARK
jgi:hypothetical protein